MDFVGQTIGQYQIKEKLDKDNPGMSEVYRGYNPHLNREVVVKILSTALARDPTFVQRFQQEAWALARLKHPHIVSVYDAGHYAQFDYLVMEFVPGGSLNELINREGPLPLARSVAIIKDIADALDYAHRSPHNMVHRDIKPANILLDSDGSAKLTDFGLVKVAEVSLTVVGQRFGTPAYMSPEQVLPISGVGPWTDIYALGLVAYQMLTKHLPFRGTVQQVLDGQLKQRPPSLRLFRPDLPHEVDEVVLKALSKAPGERYPSAGAFASALEVAARVRPVVPDAATALPNANPYATRMMEVVPRPDPSNEARTADQRPQATPTYRPVATEPPISAVQPLPPLASYEAMTPPLPPTASQARRRRYLLPIILLIVAVVIFLILLVVGGVLWSQRARIFGLPSAALRSPSTSLGSVQSDTVSTSVTVEPAGAVPTHISALAPIAAPTSIPTAAPTSVPAVLPVSVSEITATSVFTGDLPIRLTVQGVSLNGVTKAQLVAPNHVPVALHIERADESVLILILETVSEPLAGAVIYSLELDGAIQSSATLAMQDYRERKPAQGILEAYNYTNRVAADTTSPYTQLREQPRVDSGATATLRNNDQVDILRSEGDWYLLRISAASDPAQNGRVGWLEHWLVDNHNVPAQPTAAPEPTAIPAIAFGVRVDVTYEGSGNSGQFTSCVSGKVLGPGGRPYVGAVINVNNGPKNSFSGRTNKNGIYNICGLGASRWSVVLQNVSGQHLQRQAVGRVYVNGGAQDAIVNFSQR